MLLRKGNNAAMASSSRAVGLVDLTITANQQIFVASRQPVFMEGEMTIGPNIILSRD
jgi:hypothetical protein